MKDTLRCMYALFAQARVAALHIPIGLICVLRDGATFLDDFMSGYIRIVMNTYCYEAN